MMVRPHAHMLRDDCLRRGCIYTTSIYLIPFVVYETITIPVPDMVYVPPRATRRLLHGSRYSLEREAIIMVLEWIRMISLGRGGGGGGRPGSRAIRCDRMILGHQTHLCMYVSCMVVPVLLLCTDAPSPCSCSCSSSAPTTVVAVALGKHTVVLVADLPLVYCYYYYCIHTNKRC